MTLGAEPNQTEWDDVDRAQWILENGKPEIIWIFERANNIVYKRPATGVGVIPPWINTQRIPVTTHEHIFKEQEDT